MKKVTHFAADRRVRKTKLKIKIKIDLGCMTIIQGTTINLSGPPSGLLEKKK